MSEATQPALPVALLSRLLPSDVTTPETSRTVVVPPLTVLLLLTIVLLLVTVPPDMLKIPPPSAEAASATLKPIVEFLTVSAPCASLNTPPP